ncbi:dodecin family protein [Teredinibacter waterburyi]|jgi:Uncharacterized conserved protein|uniref:dodecin family protein n=1 Tax=Teredinibacter waterburyi TaxID=1500538 RepID=UPI00165F957F|nr:dodecin family protein [Teredinibacter waterburyi]
MSIAKVTEIISSSPKSFEDAIDEGVRRAGKTIQNIQSAWVKDQSVRVNGSEVTEYRVTMMITFILKD